MIFVERHYIQQNMIVSVCFWQDFLKPEALKVGGVFFDALFNLNKFIGFEQRDPFAERQRRNDPFETDWDR